VAAQITSPLGVMKTVSGHPAWPEMSWVR